MNREQKIKAVEKVIEKTKAWICLHLEVADEILVDVKPRLATAIVDSMEIDKDMVSDILHTTPYQFVMQNQLSNYSDALTEDIIKIKE